MVLPACANDGGSPSAAAAAAAANGGETERIVGGVSLLLLLLLPPPPVWPPPSPSGMLSHARPGGGGSGGRPLVSFPGEMGKASRTMPPPRVGRMKGDESTCPSDGGLRSPPRPCLRGLLDGVRGALPLSLRRLMSSKSSGGCSRCAW